MEGRTHARLLNADGELIAEGPCHLDERARTATLEPEREPGVIQKERGALALELESGRSLRVSDRAMIVRVRPTQGDGAARRRTFYRLHLLRPADPVDAGAGADAAQDAEVAGVAGEGAPAAQDVRPSEEGAPATR